jgi:hypothetical protein
MAICIKTQILKEFEQLMNSIFIIKTVKINPVEIPHADDLSLRPICCIFDDDETNIKIINRYREAEFQLMLETWLHCDKSDDMSAALDEMQAQQYKAITNVDSISSYRPLVKTIIEKPFKKVYANDHDCALLYPFDIVYRYIVGDPYTLNVGA